MLCYCLASNECFHICHAGDIMPFDKLTQTGPLSGELNQGRNVLERIVINQLGRIDIQAHPVLYLRNGAPIDRPYTDNGGEDTGGGM